MFDQFNNKHAEGKFDFSINRLTLAFKDDNIESGFKSAYFENNLLIGRICHLIAISFFGLVGSWDAVVIDPSRLTIWIWVIFFVTIFFLAGFLSSYFFLDHYKRHWQKLFAFYVLMTGAGFTIITISGAPNYPVYNFMGIIFCLFFCYAFIRLTFLWASAAGNFVVFFYTVASAAVFVDLGGKQLFISFFYMFGINLLGMMVCYSLELMSRRDFMLNTLLKQAQDESKELNATLEQKVRERTGELKLSFVRERELESQLLQAQKMESVGRLAGGVAHDYNNISSIIMGYSELAMDQLNPEDPMYLNFEQILSASKRASEITRQLLAFARKQTIAPVVIDLNETVGQMLKILRRLIGEDIHLEWLPGKDIWAVKIDPSQVDQILANLSVNARDAIADTGRLTIETANITFDRQYCDKHMGFVPGSYASLVVSDDGKGMTPEILKNIFEPFYTTKGVGKGTGLGLATVYGIVKQNNGFINVYSEPGKGTTVKVYLPRTQQKKIETRIQKVTEPLSEPKETILFVEDDKSILGLGRKMLSSLGYTVLETDTPGDAVDIAGNQENSIDLMITDVIMPEMNGRQLAGKIQEIYPDIKILFMSGYTANVISHHGVLEKGVNFISKPFSREELAAKIREVLEGKTAGQTG